MNNETRSGNHGGSHRWHVAVGSRGCRAYSFAPAVVAERRHGLGDDGCRRRSCRAGIVDAIGGRAGLGATRNHVRFCCRSVMASLERSLDMRHASAADMPLNWPPWRSPLEGTAVSTKKVARVEVLGRVKAGTSRCDPQRRCSMSAIAKRSAWAALSPRRGTQGLPAPQCGPVVVSRDSWAMHQRALVLM